MEQTGGRGSAGTLAQLLREHRRGRGLTQEQLAEQAGLSVRSVQDLERGLAVPRRDTLERLVRALGLEGQTRVGFEAAARPRPRRERSAHEPESAGVRTNLPRQLTSFVGRELEVQELQHVLRSTLLLTLTGTGGVGKTRVALRVAEAVLAYYQDGVWLVELAPLTDANLVPHAVASALAVREEPGRALRDTLAAALRPKQLLLVLDNCEHVVVACAELAELLLRACPNLRILATSREPLRVAGETTWRVPSLSLPGRLEGRLVDETVRSEAGRLFVERALAARPDFVLTDRTARAVAEACRRLDGIPLALELAAARVRALDAEQIAARLDDRFRLLVGGSRTAPPRQQTLRAAVEWSYDLLDPQEQRLFERLAVFDGGWTVEAAESVCSGDGLDPSEVLGLLAQLVDKSLVIAENREGQYRYRMLDWLRGSDIAVAAYGPVAQNMVAPESDRDRTPRFRMLEPIRWFAAEQLARSGDRRLIVERHADFFVHVCETAMHAFQTAEQQQALTRVERDNDNVRAAMVGFLERQDFERASRLASAMWGFWLGSGHYVEARTWIERLLALPGFERLIARATLLQLAAQFGWMTGDLRGTRAAAEEALQLLRALGEERGMATALNFLGLALTSIGEYTQARAVLEEGLAVGSRTHEMQFGNTMALANRAYLMGASAEALARGEEARARAQAQGRLRQIGESGRVLGWAHYLRGDIAAAEQLWKTSEEIYERIGDRFYASQALIGLAWVAIDRGDFEPARARLVGAVDHYRQTGNRLFLARDLEGFAELAAGQGQPERAVRLASGALAMREGISAVRAPAEDELLRRRLAPACKGLSSADTAEFEAAGGALSVEELVEYAIAADASESLR